MKIDQSMKRNVVSCLRLSVIYALCLPISILLCSKASWALNETPSSNGAVIFDTIHFHYTNNAFYNHFKRVVARNLGQVTGQQYRVTQRNQMIWNRNRIPRTTNINSFRRIISSDSGVIVFIGHGGKGALFIEHYETRAARDRRYNRLIASGYGHDEIVRSIMPGVRGFWANVHSIGVTRKFIEKYGSLGNAKPLVNLVACYGATVGDSFTTAGARIAVGYPQPISIISGISNLLMFIERMNGVHGIDQRPVSRAKDGLGLMHSGDPDTTLAPAINHFVKLRGDPTCVLPGDYIRYSFDTKMKQAGVPEILTNHSQNVTLKNVLWVNDHILTAEIESVSAPIVRFVVDNTLSLSEKSDDLRLDGNTDPANENAAGPAWDNYVESMPVCDKKKIKKNF